MHLCITCLTRLQIPFLLLIPLADFQTSFLRHVSALIAPHHLCAVALKIMAVRAGSVIVDGACIAA